MPGDIGDLKPVEPITGSFLLGEVEVSKLPKEQAWLESVLVNNVADHIYRLNFLKTEVTYSLLNTKLYDAKKSSLPNASPDEINFEVAKELGVDNYTTGKLEPKEGKVFFEYKINRVKDNKTLLNIKLLGTEDELLALSPTLIYKIYPELQGEDLKLVQSFTYKNLAALKKFYTVPENATTEQKIAIYKEVEQMDPESAFIDAYRGIALQYQELKKWDEAISYRQKRVDALVQKGLGESPTMVLFLKNFSDTYRKKGDLENQMKILGKQIALQEKLKLTNNYEYANANYYLGVAAYELYKDCETIAPFEKAIATFTQLGKQDEVTRLKINTYLSNSKAGCKQSKNPTPQENENKVCGAEMDCE